MKHLFPNYVVMENVTGIIAKKRAKPSQYFCQIKKECHQRSSGTSAQEFGVPEKRKRAIFIGTKKKIDICFPIKPTASHPYSTVADAF